MRAISFKIRARTVDRLSREQTADAPTAMNGLVSGKSIND